MNISKHIFIYTISPYNTGRTSCVGDWKKQLMAYYRETRGKLPLLPGMPEECGNMDDLYIQMKILEEHVVSASTQQNQLKSYQELVSLKDKSSGKNINLVLVRAGPGGGKTTTVSKMAYDWATENLINSTRLAKCKLLIVLKLREVEPGMTLIDAIQDQLLPTISEYNLRLYLTYSASSVIYFLDGFDEAKWLGDKSLSNINEFKRLLCKKWLQESCVIVTTRPHCVSNFIDRFGTCTQAQLLEFSKSDIENYVERFFEISCQQPDSVQNKSNPDLMIKPLLERLAERKNENQLAHTPILLTMMCLLWRDKQSLPEKMTNLFEDAVSNLARHHFFKTNEIDDSEPDQASAEARPSNPGDHNKNRISSFFYFIFLYFLEFFLNLSSRFSSFWSSRWALASPRDQTEKMLEKELDQVLTHLGKVALFGLLEDNGKARLAFDKREFEEDVLSKATDIGLVTTERIRVRLKTKLSTSFLHKTFQEFCAAKYLTNLAKLNKHDQFKDIMAKINFTNIDDMMVLMQFCCGLSIEASEIILPFVSHLYSKKIQKLGKSACLYCGDSITYRCPWDPCLLLLGEAHYESKPKCEHLYTHLLPLFRVNSIRICFRYPFYHSSNEELMPVLVYFLKFLKRNKILLDSITDARIDLDAYRVCDLTAEIFQGFLYCVPNLDTLKMTRKGKYFKFLESKDIGTELKNTKCIGKSIGQLSNLKMLRFEGRGDFTNILEVLSQCKQLKFESNLKGFMLGPCSKFNLKSLTTMLSKLTNLGSFTLSRYRKYTSRKSLYVCVHDERYVASALLKCLAPRTMRQVIIEQNEIPARSLGPLIPTLCRLDIRYFLTSESRDIFAILYKIGREQSDNCQQLPCMFLKLSDWIPSRSFRKRTDYEISIVTEAVAIFVDTFVFLQNLRVLNLRASAITEKGFVLIGRELHRLKCLQELNLSNNEVGKSSEDDSHVGEAWKEICRSLEKLPHIRKLILWDTLLGPGEMSLLGNALPHLPNLELLNLCWNDIEGSVVNLCKGFDKLKILKEVNLTSSNLTDRDISTLPFHSMNEVTQLFVSEPEFGIVKSKTLIEMEKGKKDYHMIRVNRKDYYHYGPKGVQTLFTHLQYMKKLTQLEVMFIDEWKKTSMFLKQCYEQCALEKAKSTRDSTILVLKQEQIRAIVEYVQNHP